MHGRHLSAYQLFLLPRITRIGRRKTEEPFCHKLHKSYEEEPKRFFVLIRETCPEHVEGFVARFFKVLLPRIARILRRRTKKIFFVLIREIRGEIFLPRITRTGTNVLPFSFSC